MITVVVGTLLVLVSAAIAVGRAQPASDPIQGTGVTACGDKFCFQDMEPGVTKWSDISGRLKGAIPTNRSGVQLHYGAVNVEIMGMTLDEESSLTQIRVEPVDNRVSLSTLGSWVSMLGAPECVYVSSGGYWNTVALRYSSVVFVFANVHERLTMNTPVAEMYLLGDDSRASAETKADAECLEWQGLTTFQRYEKRWDSRMSQ